MTEGQKHTKISLISEPSIEKFLRNELTKTSSAYKKALTTAWYFRAGNWYVHYMFCRNIIMKMFLTFLEYSKSYEFGTTNISIILIRQK